MIPHLTAVPMLVGLAVFTAFAVFVLLTPQPPRSLTEVDLHATLKSAHDARGALDRFISALTGVKRDSGGTDKNGGVS